MDRPHLILDCYIEEPGGAASLAPFLGERPIEVARPPHGPTPERASDYASLWVSGSAASVNDPQPWIQSLLALLRDALAHDVPVFGVCFGHQALASALAGPGAVRRAPHSELGWTTIELCARNELLAGLPPRFDCFASHFDEVVPGLRGVQVFARNARCAVQGFQVEGRRAVGVQFHPEMPPEECEELVRANLALHPDLGPDPEPVLARAVDGRPLGHHLAANFLRSLEPRG